MLYAMTGVAGISGVPGCPAGHRYEDRPDQSDLHMSIACGPHEAHLKKTKDPLWAATPSEVPLTAEEKRAAERQKAQADDVVARMMTQFAAQAMAAVAGAQQVPAPALAAPVAPEAPALVSGAPEPAAAAKPKARRSTAKATA